MDAEKHSEIKAQMIKYAYELQQRLWAYESLRQISQWSYAERQFGRRVPYMAIIDVDPATKAVARIVATPTVAQKDLAEFFGERAPGSARPRFTLEVRPDGVFFTERFGRGHDQVRDVNFFEAAKGGAA